MCILFNFNSLSMAPEGLKLKRSVIVIFDEPKLWNLGIEDTQDDGYGQFCFVNEHLVN